jgi:hypothetical protein
MDSISKAFPVAGMPGMNPPWSVPGRWLRSHPVVGRDHVVDLGCHIGRGRKENAVGVDGDLLVRRGPGNTWCSTKSSASQSAAYRRFFLSNTSAANMLTGRSLVSEHLAQHDCDHYDGDQPEAVQPAGGGVDRDRPDDPGGRDHLHQSPLRQSPGAGPNRPAARSQNRPPGRRSRPRRRSPPPALNCACAAQGGPATRGGLWQTPPIVGFGKTGQKLAIDSDGGGCRDLT